MVRLVRPTLVILCFSCVPGLSIAQDWPGWRGERSNGVGVVSRAPERWSPTENVVWRAEIEGSGISSPVVVGQRVYVTTAIVWERRTVFQLVVGSFALFGIPTLAYYKRKRQQTERVSRVHRTVVLQTVHVLDAALFVLLAATVLVFATCMAMGPHTLDVPLHIIRDVGVTVARSLGRLQTNLSILTWSEAAEHNRWIISSAMAVASLGLIPFLFPSQSITRVASALAMLVGLALAMAYIPWPQGYGAHVPTGILIVPYLPVIAIAVWHVFRYVVGQRQCGSADGAGTTTGVRLASIVPPALSLAMCVSPNLSRDETVVTRRLVCFDMVSGQKIWRTDAFTARPEPISALNSYATPTPSVAGDTIVAAFGPGVAAFNLDGRLRWSQIFPGWIEGSVYGAGSSPIIDGSMVFVTNDREYESQRQSQVIAYSLQTGAELWRQSPQFAHDGYATPVIHHDGNRTLLLTLTARTLVAYVASNGEVAWRLTTPVGNPVPSLIVNGDTLYVTGGLSGGYTAAYHLRHDAAPEELWTSHRSPADVSSPLLYKDRLFTITSTGVMVSYNAESGDVIWRERVGSGLGVFYSSLVAADDKVYAVRSNGTTYVIAVDDRFRMVSESSLHEEIFASPAFARDCLLLRTVSALYCIGSEEASH